MLKKLSGLFQRPVIVVPEPIVEAEPPTEIIDVPQTPCMWCGCIMHGTDNPFCVHCRALVQEAQRSLVSARRAFDHLLKARTGEDGTVADELETFNLLWPTPKNGHADENLNPS